MADLDWYGLYAEELITEIGLDESVRNKKMELHEEIALYKQIAEETANELDLSKMEITGIVSLYLKILLMEEKGAASEELVRRLNGFWQQQLAYTGMEINRERHVIEQILRELRVKEIQQDLAYYTSMDTFFKMLPVEL